MDGLSEEKYYKTVYGGWLGKNIGGTLGAPVEGRKERLGLTYYPVLPDGPLENDDLDLQLVNLHALEQYGTRLTARLIAQEWLEHVFFPFDEYGYALANLRRGLLPPVAGFFDNPFADCMGSPIRSEIWAMAAPGAPAVAARYAYEDANVDHAGGEGVYGEMFFAALESAIFAETDRDRLIAIGLSFIPEVCRTAKAVRDLQKWHRDGSSWTEARELVLLHHGSDNFTDAPQNVAFTILGWLYGESFEDAILKTVNCGYDTDCTAATLGAILGMIGGPEALPVKWTRPLGDKIVVSPPIKGFPVPADLNELTLRTMRIGRQVLACWGITPGASHWHPDDGIRALWREDPGRNRWLLPEPSSEPLGLELRLDYGAGGPSIGAGREKTLAFTLVNHSRESWQGRFSLDVPAGWEAGADQPIRLGPGESGSFPMRLRSGGSRAPSYRLTARIIRNHDQAVWHELSVPFSLVAAPEWQIGGPDGTWRDAVFSGTRLEWEQLPGSEEADGIYRARTRLTVPSGRTMRLIVASRTPVKVQWNGETLIESGDGEEWMPAFHRAPASQRFERFVEGGSYLLEIETVKNGRPLETRVLPVAGGEPSMAGPYFYFTDTLFTGFYD
ncbi:hypothetical protein GE107_21115 [Cohnella sp. CFH 77786]|uniref:ADP-ribosylglycohydrolase family protein n=1 Tax=Cohnella sp. CFH 77786 TaxID=2662265 RepID=UPI001C60EB99|nr:ADP-ribosylglycohydrolase family protein [Cohnella sp. CFH 77786]MBW5448551.1 hypothetical protein [Cohnella sp. CFH 77786]